MIRPTIELGHPALRQAAAPVDDPLSPTTQALIVDLRETLADYRARNGWGRALSAPVIEVPSRIVMIDYQDQPIVLINPVLTAWDSVSESTYESCMTFPALWGCVSRATSVVVQAYDEHGVMQRWEAEHELARIMQHELDHLDGFVWLDREPELETICTNGEYQRRYRGH